MIADRLDNRHFLVVDDEAFIRTLISRYLKRSGAAAVVEVADGREAIAAIGAHDMVFDAVVTDVRMQPIDGLELLRAIRTGAGGLKRNMPVIMLTSHSESHIVTEALALDADGFVVKPVEHAVLISRVVRALRRLVPIQSASSYAFVGPDGAPRPISAMTIDPAPPTKALMVSEDLPLSPAPPPHLEPTQQARMLPLDRVMPNSILARDIILEGTERLLIAAPVILTAALLERLADLETIYGFFPNLFVFETTSAAEASP
jgi:CheY-like chemotaxis protein